MDAASLVGGLLVMQILKELVEDGSYPCRCGQDPYLDGDTCPKCAAIVEGDSMNTASLVGGLLVIQILKELVEDGNYPCRCGQDPYLDGDTCPKCAAIVAIELWERYKKSYEK